MAAAGIGGKVINVHHKESYAYGTKAAREDPSQGRETFLQRLERKYNEEGLRRSVSAVLLVHEHGHPHVLALQENKEFRLPGGRLRAGESGAQMCSASV